MSKTFVSTHVKRHEPQLIRPEKPTPIEIKKLSDIDDQEYIRLLASAIFLYPSSAVGKSISSSSSEDPVETIRQGLAKALVFYYPLAGRMFEVRPDRKLMVDCNSEGVVFVEADADVSLEQLGNGVSVPPHTYAEDFLCPLPRDFGGVTGSPLLFFQVTRLACGGFVLGVRINHNITDAYGLKLLLKAIAKLVKGASEPSIRPTWQRDLLHARSPPRITCIHNEYENEISHVTSPVDHGIINNTSIFFGTKEITALSSQLPQSNYSFTKFDLITACLWKCRTIALETDPDEIVRVTLITSVHATKVIQLPISYYGNTCVATGAASKAKDLCTRPLAYALELIRLSKDRVNKEFVRSTADFLVLRKRPDLVSKWNYVVTDHRTLGIDRLDLGWGEPLYGGFPSGKPNSSVFANFKNDKGEDGILVSICLPPLAVKKVQNEIQKMVCDDPISKL